jgi:DNA polymerase-3 subunit gamma/tau
VSQTLYRKYRSRSLEDVVGQEHITKTLASAIKAGHISHAYLLTGPRGVGKTSIARILAHQINDLPYNDEENHLDIIEIDAASNRGIEEIRDLREKVALAPTSAKYKVYIIDEVHMLTPPAFNALLKTLEEPPAHVIFILATTELHKLPETIISRTQRHSFKPISSADMVPHLRYIADTEKISINDEALQMIARHADGGFRDAISLLDQVRNQGSDITEITVADLIGLPPRDQIADIIEAVASADANKAIVSLDDLFERGYHPQLIISNLLLLARERLISAKSQEERDRMLKLMEASLHTGSSANPRLAIEVAIYRSAYGELASTAIAPEQKPVVKTAKAIPVKKPEKAQATEVEVEQKIEKEGPKADAPKEKVQPSSQLSWDDVLNAIKGDHNTLYGILRMAEADCNNEKSTLILSFQFPFHMKRASEGKNSQIIASTIRKITNKDFEIRYEKRTMNAQKEITETPKVENTSDALDTVRSVFGDAEIVRS